MVGVGVASRPLYVLTHLGPLDPAMDSQFLEAERVEQLLKHRSRVFGQRTARDLELSEGRAPAQLDRAQVSQRRRPAAVHRQPPQPRACLEARESAQLRQRAKADQRTMSQRNIPVDVELTEARTVSQQPLQPVHLIRLLRAPEEDER